MTAAQDSSEQTEIQEQWQPTLSPRQWDVMRNNAKILLLSGPRWSGKSIVLAHKAVMRAWEIYEANIGIVVSSYKVATAGGVWSDLEDAAQEWMRAGIVSEYGADFAITSMNADGNPGSRNDGASRTPMMTIRNKFGTESTIRLISLDNENEVEKKLKTTRFQFIWVVELSNFMRREVLCVAEDQLRATLSQSIPGSPYFWPDEMCQLVADTNPAADGKKNWIYRWFYEKDSGMVPAKYQAQVDGFAKKMCIEEIFLDDNTFLPPTKKDDLIGKYAGDPELFERFVLGKWPDGSLDKSYMFADVLSDANFVDDFIDVSELTETIYCGWDLGPVNKAAVMVEKRIVEGVSVWSVLDELVYIGDPISTTDFTLQWMEKMIRINAHYREKRPKFKGFEWEHWSDSSSFNPNTTDEGGTEALEVFNASNGQIDLKPSEKPAKSVEVGCQIIRKLLREERLFLGHNTPHLEKSLRNIKRSLKLGKTLDMGDPLKHVMDALRYVLFMLLVDELMTSPVQDKWRNKRTISIAL